MVDWKQSLPQIIASVIGSGLIVASISAISSFISKPILDIFVDPKDSNRNNQNMSYTVILTNVGYTPATHLRLTMSYPGARILDNSIHHQSENMTLENSSSSVVVFLPRLTPGASISIDTYITRNESDARDITDERSSRIPGLIDYEENTMTYHYYHNEPYSIIATYDQGSSIYSPPTFSLPLDTGILRIFLLILIGFFFIVIPFRRKKESSSKFVSNILKDIEKVNSELKQGIDGHPNVNLIKLYTLESNIDAERKIITDYRDYQKITDFYSAIRSRNSYLFQNQVSEDILEILNEECVNQAVIAQTEIDWKKFNNLDLVMLIPAVVLVSLFITYVCEFIPITFLNLNRLPINYAISIILGIPIARTTASFFLLRLVLKAVQGSIVTAYGLPPVSKSFALSFFSFTIGGIPSYLLIYLLPSYLWFLIFIVDIGRMFLLTWLVWRRYMKHKVKTTPFFHHLLRRHGT